MLGILAPNKLFLNSISVFTVYTELETLPNRPHSALGYRPPAPQSILKIVTCSPKTSPDRELEIW